MGYQSVNEIDQFSFRDCVIDEFKISDSQVTLMVEALIVLPRNSQNGNFTESYAGPTTIRLIGGEVRKGIRDGYRYYDANEVLISEKPDEDLTEEELANFPVMCEGSYFFAMDYVGKEENKQIYELSFEFVDAEEGTAADSFRIEVAFEKAIFNWEMYLNRVQN